MRLKILAPFQTNFEIKSEQPIRDPVEYAQFWTDIAASKAELRTVLSHRLPLSSELKEIGFLHQHRLNPHNRYRSLDNDSLERTIHVMELNFDEVDFNIIEFHPTDAADTSILSQLFQNVIHLTCRVYDHSISLLELDIDLEDWLQARPQSEVPDFLDEIQRASIELGAAVSQWCYDTLLKHIFTWLMDEHAESHRFVDTSTQEMDETREGKVLWVTRTLIFEQDEPDNRETIVRHWLKDSGGADNKELVDEVVKGETQHMTRWLNYLFREKSYETLEIRWDKQSHCVWAFNDEWEAMIYAQYFYGALDILDLHLTKILAYTLADEPNIQIEQQKNILADNIRKTNLLLIQLHDSSKYYKRAVKAHLDAILAYWDFDELLVQPVQRKITLCQERLTVLHQQAAAKSAIYTDMILLGIGVTSIFGTFIALAEYGRTMANDVNLASYDVNSTNIVDWFSAQPTDVILVVSSILSLLLVVLYFYYRQLQAS